VKFLDSLNGCKVLKKESAPWS